MRSPSSTRAGRFFRARRTGSERGGTRRLFFSAPAAVAALVAALVVLSAAGLVPSAGASRPASSGLGAAAHPDAAGSYCYSVNSSICVSMVNSTEPDIIPAPGSHVSSTHPDPTDSLSLYVESKNNLIWNYAHSSGPLSPISLNVTGTLWNGVPYYNANDSSIWHPPGTSWWGYGPTGQNSTYPYWYTINFTARSSSGAPNFYPGMSITWWLYFVTNTSGVIAHTPKNETVYFHFTYGLAWPYTPYPGTVNSAGSAAALEDVGVTQFPLIPNFNDTVRVTLATTSADLVTGATIGGGYLDASEFAPDGALLHAGTFVFNVTVVKSEGPPEANITLPASYSQNPGALVEYRVTAWDTNTYGPDEVVTPLFNYTVNGNGSFRAHSFVNDLALTGTPVGPRPAGLAPPTVEEGQPIHLVLASSNAGTSILAAEVDYSMDYGALGENASFAIAMARVNSTHFDATIPAMPLNVTVTYTVVAWDFAQDRDTSPMYEYRTPSLADTLLTVPTNSTFFLAYVYDAGTSSWVSGATLDIRGLSGYVHISTTTLGGIAYPNATGRGFVPLFLPAGESYRLWVNDSSFLPPGQISPSVSILFVATHDLTGSGILAVGSDYEVAESGNAFYFWLNETPPAFTYSAPGGGIGASTVLLAAIGLGAFAVVSVPTFFWFRQIRARRQAEERRITL